MPKTYAAVTRTIVKETCPVAASVAIVARIGPAQGDHTIPNDNL